jgi:hypothetical protein
MASLEKVHGTGLERLHPGHGDDMDQPDQVLGWYLAHRRQRHEEIFAAIAAGAGSVPDVVEVVYTDVDRSLHPLAAMSVQAHVRLLMDQDRIALRDDRLVAVPDLP